MARRVLSASSQYWETLSAVITGTPATMAAWYFPITLGSGSLINVDNSASALRLALETQLGAPRALQTGAGAGANATTTAVPSVGMWCHACARFTSDTSRDAFLNGGNKVNNGTSTGACSGLNVSLIGARHISSAYGAFNNALIAEAAVWNVALDDSEIYALSSGVSPAWIRPAALAALWHLDGRGGLELDDHGRYALANTGASMPVPHPAFLRPLRKRRVIQKITGGAVTGWGQLIGGWRNRLVVTA